MTGIPEKKKRLTIVLGALGVICLIFVGYLFWPGKAASAERQQLILDLRGQVKAKELQVAPGRGMQQKLIQTRADVAKLYKENVPRRWSQISDELQKLAQQTGVSAGTKKYSTEDVGLNGVQRVIVETSIAGDYSKIPRFINALERSNTLFVITSISVNEQQGGTVELRIRFETY